MGSTRRGTARPTTGLVNGVIKVVARRLQQTASGGKQIHAPFGVVVYSVACFIRVANATISRSTLLTRYTLKQFLRHWEYECYSVLCYISSRVRKWRTEWAKTDDNGRIFCRPTVHSTLMPVGLSTAQLVKLASLSPRTAGTQGSMGVDVLFRWYSYLGRL